MKDPWHCNWADRENQPDEKLLAKWSVSSWLQWKARELQIALADINHTLAIIGGKDEVIGKCRAIESEVMGYLTERFPVDIPVLTSYQPIMVDRLWLGSRIKELERQRDTFSTYSYWKDPRPEKEHANKALNLVTTGIGRYTIISAQDWRGVIEVLQEYVEQLERLQLLMLVIHNEQTFGEGAMWGGSVAKLGKKLRISLRTIHTTLLNDTMVNYPALEVRPWKHDAGVDWMTWDEFQNTPHSHWDHEGTAPPRLTDGPIFEEGRVIGIEELIEQRRQAIDAQLQEYRAGKFGIVKGFLRRERKIWGNAQISVAQFKRHLVFPGQIEAMVEAAEAEDPTLEDE